MKITVDEAAPGSGKTFSALNDMISFPARYLFVTERKDSIRSIANEVRAMAYQRSRSPHVWPVDGDNLPEGMKSVRQSVEALPTTYKDAQHVIAIITHAALMMSDLEDFTGWHIIIDEVPAVLTVQPIQTLKDVGFFTDHYTLDPLPGFVGWSIVGLTKPGNEMTSRHLYQDDSHRHLRAFHNRVREGARFGTRQVICNLTAWEEMGEVIETTAGKVGKKWIWGSLFTLTALTAFSSVTILGNRFSTSISFKLLQEAAERDGLTVQWSFRRTTRPITWQPRSVTVRYFSERSVSRTHLWSETGKEHLRRIDAYLTKMMDPKSIWSTNDDFRSSFTSLTDANRQPPKQAGSNEFSGRHEAAIIYSAKASPDLRGLLKTHGVSEADWTSTNEFETVLQFLTRTSIREPRSTAPVTFYVYDQAQAEYVAATLASQPHLTVEIEHVDLGVDVSARKRGPKVRVLTEAEIVAKAEAVRQYKAEWARKNRAKAAQ